MKYRYFSIHKLGKKYPHDYGNLQEMEISHNNTTEYHRIVSHKNPHFSPH